MTKMLAAQGTTQWAHCDVPISAGGHQEGSGTEIVYRFLTPLVSDPFSVPLAGEHLLGVALTALVRVPPARRAEVHAEALRRLDEARENDYRRYLLLDCLEAYATLDEAQTQELRTRNQEPFSSFSTGPMPRSITPRPPAR